MHESGAAPATIINGGCLCGAVRYQATETPYNVTHCHCLDCRRSSGAPFVTWASFRRDKFRFVHGEPKQIPWAGRLRAFCPDCGTPLMFLSDASAEEVDVTVSSFDDPSLASPQDHVWVEDRLPWVHLSDGLSQYRQKRSAS